MYLMLTVQLCRHIWVDDVSDADGSAVSTSFQPKCVDTTEPSASDTTSMQMVGSVETSASDTSSTQMGWHNWTISIWCMIIPVVSTHLNHQHQIHHQPKCVDTTEPSASDTSVNPNVSTHLGWWCIWYIINGSVVLTQLNHQHQVHDQPKCIWHSWTISIRYIISPKCVDTFGLMLYLMHDGPSCVYTFEPSASDVSSMLMCRHNWTISIRYNINPNCRHNWMISIWCMINPVVSTHLNH